MFNYENSLQLLQGIQGNFDQIRSQAGPAWPGLENDMLGVLLTAGEVDDDTLDLRVDDILEWGLESPAGDVFREIMAGVDEFNVDGTRLQIETTREPVGPWANTVRMAMTDLIGTIQESSYGPSVFLSDALLHNEPPSDVAYALLDCPEVVVAETEFELEVGLTSAPTPGVPIAPIEWPEGKDSFSLTVQLIAEGFTLADSHIDIQVTRTDPYPLRVIKLQAAATGRDISPKLIKALYFVDGQIEGMVTRSVVVVKSEETVAAAPITRAPPVTAIQVDSPALVDLCIQILCDPDKAGRLFWTFASPHSVTLPETMLVTDIGADPKEFTCQLMKQIDAQDGKPGLYEYMIGIAKEIGDHVPDDTWRIIEEIAKQTKRVPRVLICCEEPYVPWELAYVKNPIQESEAPPVLSAQVDIGRWILAKRQAKLPPPSSLSIDSMATITGVYYNGEWERLEESEEEARELQKRFDATDVSATMPAVLECLSDGDSNVVHFAVHGNYNPGGREDGIVLTDDTILFPATVTGLELIGEPIVFLNACQVGAGAEVLGNYAGLAAAFLSAGASAVIAPLWSVRDSIAKDVALGFYESVFSKTGECPASYLRDTRARFAAGTSATCLAYQFFGHPRLTLQRSTDSM